MYSSFVCGNRFSISNLAICAGRFEKSSYLQSLWSQYAVSYLIDSFVWMWNHPEFVKNVLIFVDKS